MFAVYTGHDINNVYRDISKSPLCHYITVKTNTNCFTLQYFFSKLLLSFAT